MARRSLGMAAEALADGVLDAVVLRAPERVLLADAEGGDAEGVVPDAPQGDLRADPPPLERVGAGDGDELLLRLLTEPAAARLVRALEEDMTTVIGRGDAGTAGTLEVVERDRNEHEKECQHRRDDGRHQGATCPAWPEPRQDVGRQHDRRRGTQVLRQSQDRARERATPPARRRGHCHPGCRDGGQVEGDWGMLTTVMSTAAGQSA